MPQLPSISNIYTEESEDGIRIRIEGEGDFLPGHLTVMVRPETENGAAGEFSDTDNSGTSEAWRPGGVPIDMGFGHFMMNMQTGAICWCPSGTLQPDGSSDWVVVNDPSIHESPGSEQEGNENGHYGNGTGGVPAMNEGTPAMGSRSRTDTSMDTHGMETVEMEAMRESGPVDEGITEENMNQSAETESACSQ